MVECGFEYSYINDILFIEDNALNRNSFHSNLENLKLSTNGDFIAFFHMEKTNNVIFTA